jgi:8-oxo-dGTP diphosphatase
MVSVLSKSDHTSQAEKQPGRSECERGRCSGVPRNAHTLLRAGTYILSATALDCPSENSGDRKIMAKAKPIVGALLVRDGKVLLGRRSQTKRTWPDCWDMPGGHVENGETFEAAHLRETLEEIGVVPLDYTILTDYAVSETEPYRIFRVDRWAGGEPRLTNHEHTALEWFSPQAAVELEPLALEAYRELFTELSESFAANA